MSELERRGDPSQITWVAKLPFARDPVFLRQMTLVILVPLAVVAVILIAILWPLDRASVVLIVRIVLVAGGFVLVLYLFVIFGVLRGRQQLRYTLDDEGVRVETAGPLKHMGIVKRLLILSGKPTYVGIGLMAQGPTSENVAWSELDGFTPDPHARTITLRVGKKDFAIVRCTKDNYEDVLASVERHVRR